MKGPGCNLRWHNQRVLTRRRSFCRSRRSAAFRPGLTYAARESPGPEAVEAGNTHCQLSTAATAHGDPGVRPPPHPSSSSLLLSSRVSSPIGLLRRAFSRSGRPWRCGAPAGSTVRGVGEELVAPPVVLGLADLLLGAQLADRPALEPFEEDQRLLGFPAASLHACPPIQTATSLSLSSSPFQTGSRYHPGRRQRSTRTECRDRRRGRRQLGHDRKRAVAGQLAVELVPIVDARMAVNANLVRSEEWNSWMPGLDKALAAAPGSCPGVCVASRYRGSSIA